MAANKLINENNSNFELLTLGKIILTVSIFDLMATILTVLVTGGNMVIFYGLFALVTATSIVTVLMTVCLLRLWAPNFYFEWTRNTKMISLQEVSATS